MDKLIAPRGEGKSRKSRLIKIAEVVGKVGLSAVPIPPVVSEVAKLGLEKIFSYVRQRDEQRILEFYRAFFYKNGVPDEGILDAEIEESNFHALLNACVSDIEEEKTIPYANLTRSIALGRVDPELRRNFILTLRDLSWDELDLLRRIYVVTKHAVIPNKGKDFDVSLLLDYPPSQISETLAVANLKAKGMVEDEKLSSAGSSFVSACSNEDDLEPVIYGYKVWSGYTCLILHLSGKHLSNSESEMLAASLRSTCIHSYSVTAIGGFETGRNDPLSRLGTNCCVILIDEEFEVTPASLEAISKIAETRPVVQVLNNRKAIDEEPFTRLPAIRRDLNKGDAWRVEAVNLLIREINLRGQVKGAPE
ncbi:hypothetical protein [Pseudomonas fluorescens]|uniref:Uncharacterized protein n=1 Tax=Pseudomonas fluorescens TaxID=294 RepID=A0A944DP32_PSEFL|nr:hypothetical protein [Pseudomonas fluorescens]MBT2294545.1 hypothetical protein [Pseudomonas fluorescens]MBT2306799.1 hypothetical protein [Pseudomonas fluorescens]MBT2316291.1 hypothetical protein [Pseudomonas fluorescens]MBT2331628.1 hypothetical protein [Pseudomonas fluorescens]MBT2342796.1 hypothetical protein [Pseudomonas fluorescens]